MGIFNRRITEADLERVRREAAADATIASQFLAHQEQCNKDKAEITRRLDSQDKQRKNMHEENSEKFNKINRIIWIATGIWGTVMFLSSDLGRSIIQAAGKVVNPALGGG